MPTKGSLKSIAGARRKRANLEARVEGLEASLERIVKIYDGQLATAAQRIRDLTRASNAASVVVSTMEEFLDERYPNWDGGKREEFRERSRLLQERQAIIEELATDLEDGAREEKAERLFTVSRHLGTEGHDVPGVVGAFIKTRNGARAAEIVKFARETEIEIHPAYAKIFDELVARVEEVLADGDE